MNTEVPEGSLRSGHEIKTHYLIEKSLAAQLRSASKIERTRLYSALYNELFQRVPNHPQLTVSPAESQQLVKMQLRLLSRFLTPESRFLEVGPGDCALSLAVAMLAKQVYAVDVSDEITQQKQTPENLQLIISDGCSIPVAPASIDLAYSHQLMEHLHPDDALEQLRNIYNALRDEGIYICITPNRLNGPHDISMYFDAVATGFHLKEYSTTELVQLFKQVGFSRFQVIISLKNCYVTMPFALIRAYENLVEQSPSWLKKYLVKRPFVWLLGIRLVALKASRQRVYVLVKYPPHTVHKLPPNAY